MEPIIASGLADATASDFAGAVYNIFFAGLVFGAGWLVVQYQRLTHHVRDVEDEVEKLRTELGKFQMPGPHVSPPEEQSEHPTGVKADAD